jgi:hypothetical protein
MSAPRLPPVGSGPRLLREAIKAAGHTEGFAAVEKFHVRRPTMSGWLNNEYKPNADHREIAWDEYRVPLAAWDSETERDRRLERMGRGSEALPPNSSRTPNPARAVPGKPKAA